MWKGEIVGMYNGGDSGHGMGYGKGKQWVCKGEIVGMERGDSGYGKGDSGYGKGR